MVKVENTHRKAKLQLTKLTDVTSYHNVCVNYIHSETQPRTATIIPGLKPRRGKTLG